MQVNCNACAPSGLISHVSRVKACPGTQLFATFAFVVLVDCRVPEHIELIELLLNGSGEAYVLVIRPPFPSQV